MTAIEAANPKTNQWKAGGRTGAGPEEAGHRRRRPSSWPCGGGWADVRLLEQEPEAATRSARPRESRRSGRRTPPAGSFRPPRWRSRGLARLRLARVEACGSRSGPPGCRARRQAQQRARHRRSPAPTSDRRRPAARARRRSSCRRSRRAGSPGPRPQRRAIGPTRASPPPGSRARCGARSSPTLDDTRRSRAPPRPGGAGSAQRERLAGERRHHLRRDPDRRRRVPGRVAVAAVGAAEPEQVPERRLAGLLPGADQRLDRPGRRLRVRLAALRQRVAAVPVPERGAARRGPGARRAWPAPAARSASIAAAVSFESGLPPRDHGNPPLFACAARIACTSAGGGCSPAARSASTTQIVSLTSTPGRWRAEPRQRRVVDRLAESRERDDPQREVGVACRHVGVRAEELERAAPARPGYPPPRRGRAPPRRSAVPSGARPCSAKPPLALWRLARNAAEPAAGPVAPAAEPARTTAASSAASHLTPTPPPCGRVRPCRSRTRRSSGPATSASTRLPSACAMLNATPGGEDGDERRPGVGVEGEPEPEVHQRPERHPEHGAEERERPAPPQREPEDAGENAAAAPREHLPRRVRPLARGTCWTRSRRALRRRSLAEGRARRRRPRRSPSPAARSGSARRAPVPRRRCRRASRRA